MKRLYITKKSVWAAQAVGLDGKPLTHALVIPAKSVRDEKGSISMGKPSFSHVSIKNYELFDTKWHSHYINLDSEYILVAGDVEHSEHFAEIWHSHPEVARLPHPIYEGSVSIKDLLNQAHAAKQYKPHHHSALLSNVYLKATPDDTVLTLSNKAKAVHPLVKISSFT